MMKKWKRVPVVMTLGLALVFSGALGERVVRADELGAEFVLFRGVIGKPLSTDPSETKVKITAYNHYINDYPDTVPITKDNLVGGKIWKVDSIGSGVFNSSNTKDLEFVGLGDFKVEKDAFIDCPKIKQISFSDTSILDGAFSGLPKLVELDLSKVKELGEGAFTNCTGLKEVTFEYAEWLTAYTMSDNAFPGCTSVSKVILKYPHNARESKKGIVQKIASALPKAQFEGYMKKNSLVDEATDKPKLNKTELENFAFNSEPFQLEITNLYAQLKDGMTVKNQTFVKEELSGKYKWTSDKPEIASVDETGLVTPHKPGKATITLTVTKGSQSQTAQCIADVLGQRFGDYEFDPVTGTILRYLGSDTKVTIPDKLNKVAVKKIAAGAFSGREDITNINVSNTVLDIEEDAFKGCTNLDNVIVSNRINSISAGAFNGIADFSVKVLYSGETDESGTPVIRHSVFEAAGIDDKITGYIIGVTPEYKPALNMTEIKDLKAGSDPVELTVSGLYPENLPAEINESNSSMEPLEVKWKSSKPSVAQVSSDGLVTPVSAGTAVITADIQGRSVSCKVQVTGGSLTVAEPDGMKLTEAARAVLAKTEPIKSAVAAGQDTTVLMIFEEKGKNEVADDAQAIDDILKEGQEAAAYYNIAFQAVIDGRMPVNVDETAGNIELEFSLDGIKKAASYKVARVHNGQAELLNAKLSPEEETLTAGSSLFSTYAIIREQENIQTPLKENENTVKIVKKPKSPVRSSLDTTPAKTGDNSHTAGVAGLTLLMLAILLRVGRNSLIKHK